MARKLRVAGIIKSVRGPGGGYVLTGEFENKTVKDVLKACGERVADGTEAELPAKTAESNTAKEIVKKLNVAVVNTSADVLLTSLTA